jgi:hypothetical protein
MTLNPKSLDLIKHPDHPDEVVLDGGPARSKQLDRECFDSLEKVLGGGRWSSKDGAAQRRGLRTVPRG